MKRLGYLYDKMLDKELIRNSINDALKHKNKTRPINDVLNNVNYYVDYFYEEIKNRRYTFTKGYIKTIMNSGKKRQIQVPALKDTSTSLVICFIQMKQSYENGLLRYLKED